MSEVTKPVAPATGSVRQREERRRFLRTALACGALVGGSVLGYVPVAGARVARLRPPGALEERDFLASCIKCGQCVQVCPVEAIHLADLDDGFGVGVPYIDSRAQACDFSCDAVQCVLACPTGSLTYEKPAFMSARAGMKLNRPAVLIAKEKDPEPTLAITERSGLAVLARPDACLARQGKGVHGPARDSRFEGKMRFMEVDRWKPIPLIDHPFEVAVCDLCFRTCPIRGAISMEPLTGAGEEGRLTPVVHEPCLGCGVCEMVCPAEPAAIVVQARREWPA